MFALLKRFRELLLVAALLLYPLVTFLLSGHKGREPNLVDRTILAVSSPLQRSLTWVIDAAHGGVEAYLSLKGAKAEATACVTELSQARAELNFLTEARAENQRLKGLLGYAEDSVEAEISARIIGLNTSAHFVSVRLNRGESDGVRSGMPVVTADGVVGQVSRAVGGSADAMLVTDPSSRLGVLVQRTRVRGTAVGAGGGEPLSLENVLKSDDVVDGDVVVTSGTDGIFPRGLVVGRVEGVRREPTGMFTRGRVAPVVDLRRVEEVLVLPSSASLPSAYWRGTAR